MSPSQRMLMRLLLLAHATTVHRRAQILCDHIKGANRGMVFVRDGRVQLGARWGWGGGGCSAVGGGGRGPWARPAVVVDGRAGKVNAVDEVG